MPARRASRLWILGVVSVSVVAGLAAVAFKVTHERRPAAKTATAFDATTPLPALAAALRESDGRALAALYLKAMPPKDGPALPCSEAEAAEWVEALDAVRSGFLRFGSYGRSSALVVAGRVLQRIAVNPAPEAWARTLPPSHDLLTAGLADGDLDVRVAALIEVGKLWSWNPGRTLLPTEEDVIADWKNGFLEPTIRRLGDRDPKARAAAVASLGTLPIDAAAAPALAYLDDPTAPEVRRQVLISFAARPTLLTEDALLKRIYDTGPGISETAALVLKTRGFNQEQISLGSMIFHPKPEMRASVIPLLKERTDVDPVVWLLQLSRDPEELVQIGTVEALAQRLTPEVGQRLAEMAKTDKSASVRRAAFPFLALSEKTAALPPLPASPSLNPKAN